MIASLSPAKSNTCARPLALDPRQDPDLAGAAVDLGGLHLERVIERRHRLAHVDHVAIAILPVVEKLERVGDLFEGFGGHGPLRGRISL
jgi:hypothetical protein